MDTLPNEVLFKIIRYLDIDSLYTLSEDCRWFPLVDCTINRFPLTLLNTEINPKSGLYNSESNGRFKVLRNLLFDRRMANQVRRKFFEKRRRDEAPERRRREKIRDEKNNRIRYGMKCFSYSFFGKFSQYGH